MRDDSVNIVYLAEFVHLAETLSFKRTADHFYVSRSVISRHVAALEDTLGARLLDRVGRTVALTESGRVFYRDAKVVLGAWRVALERVRDVRGDAIELARVGYLRNAARPVVVRFARRMAESHPDVQLSLTCMEYADLRRAMEEHAVDVALAMNVNPDISRNYRSTRIYDDTFYAVCSAAHPLAALPGPLSPDDLRGHKLLFPDSFRDVGLSELVDVLAAEGDSPHARELYRDPDILHLKVQAEGYVAFSSGRNAALFDDQVVMMPISGVNTAFAVSAFYHDDFAGEAYRACREAFEWCHGMLEA